MSFFFFFLILTTFFETNKKMQHFPLNFLFAINFRLIKHNGTFTRRIIQATNITTVIMYYGFYWPTVIVMYIICVCLYINTDVFVSGSIFSSHGSMFTFSVGSGKHTILFCKIISVLMCVCVFVVMRWGSPSHCMLPQTTLISSRRTCCLYACS